MTDCTNGNFPDTVTINGVKYVRKVKADADNAISGAVHKSNPGMFANCIQPKPEPVKPEVRIPDDVFTTMIRGMAEKWLTDERKAAIAREEVLRELRALKVSEFVTLSGGCFVSSIDIDRRIAELEATK